MERAPALQYDRRLDSERFTALLARGASEQEIGGQKQYVLRQLKTDIGERLHRSESPYIYHIRNNKLFGEGESEPFEEVIEKGVVRRFDGTRENAELIGFQFMQSVMTDPQTPDGTIIFNPSPPDGDDYQEDYLDVYEKKGDEVSAVRYLSTLTNTEYRQKIISLNPTYAGVLPENPSDIDFFLNPVVVPSHLRFSKEELALYILGEKTGIDERDMDRIWSKTAFIWTSYVNTLAENPEALITLELEYNAGLNAAYRESKGEYETTFSLPRMEIQYLSQQPVMIGGGGCGNGSCSTTTTSSGDISAEITLLSNDIYGERTFPCPDCGERNIRWEENQLLTECQNKDCKSKKVRPN